MFASPNRESPSRIVPGASYAGTSHTVRCTRTPRLVSGVRRCQGHRHSLPFCCHSNGEIPPRLSYPANSRANFLGLRRARSTLSGGPRQPLYSKSDITVPALQWQVPQTETAHARSPRTFLGNFPVRRNCARSNDERHPVGVALAQHLRGHWPPPFLPSAVGPPFLLGSPAGLRFARWRRLLLGGLSLADVQSSQPVHHWHPV
jgi:hypothetical protein